MSDDHVLIAGAGIGGLTAALALHRRGIGVTVLERAHTMRPLGVGINLLPHAVRELTELGLGDSLAQFAVAPNAIQFYGHRGDLLFTEPRGLAAGDSHPQLSVHRGRLQMLLLRAARDRMGTDVVRTGAAVRGFDQGADDVLTRTAAGAVRGAVLVGADGIGSTVRAALHPGPDPLMWSGITMYRGASRTPAFLDGRTMVIVKGPNGIGLVTYPIGDGLVNWVLQVPAGPAGVLGGEAHWNASATAADVLPYLRDWKIAWLDTDGLIGRTDDIFSYPMVDRDPLPHWGFGRVTLLGDAAHPMYPVGANGGSQSIVDARVLADEYARDGVAGLHRYADQRRRETAEVILANREMHDASNRDDELEAITTKSRTATARSTRS